jgi:hypothetical protein
MTTAGRRPRAVIARARQLAALGQAAPLVVLALVSCSSAGGKTATGPSNGGAQASRSASSAPPALGGVTWTRSVTPADVSGATSGQPPPVGRWLLSTGSVGWQLRDPTGGGLLFDVAYGPGARLQMRPVIEYPPYPNANNGGFCADTDPLWSWTYSVGSGGATLTLRPSGHDPCGDRAAVLAGTWKRTGR